MAEQCLASMPARKAPGRPSSEARILMSPSRSIPQNVLLPIVSLRFCMVWNERKPFLPDLSYHEMESSHIGYLPGMARQIGNNKNARNWNASAKLKSFLLGAQYRTDCDGKGAYHASITLVQANTAVLLTDFGVPPSCDIEGGRFYVDVPCER